MEAAMSYLAKRTVIARLLEMPGKDADHAAAVNICGRSMTVLKL
jgi:hypothetical protein